MSRIVPASVLITGATGGIGGALAQIYARPGIELILQGRNEMRLAELAANCRARGAGVRARVLDLRDRAALKAWLAEVSGQVPIDLAVVNAGVSTNVGADGSGERWEAVEELLEVNVMAAMATVDALLPPMRARRRGQIALVSSLAAWYGMPLTPAYSASKAALKAYGEALRGWLEPQGVAVNVVLPGFVRTGMSARFIGPKPFMMDAEEAARRIVRGLESNQARISFPFGPGIGMRLLAVLPPALSQHLLKMLGYGG